MTLSWLLLAAALGLLGPASAAQRGARTMPRTQLPAGAVRALAGAAALLLCVALVGPGRGVLLGLVLVPAAAAGAGRLPGRPRAPRGADPALPLALDLVAVALRAGQPPAAALALAAPAASSRVAERLDRVAALLRLGADPAEAWRAAADEPALDPVAATACRSASSGIRLAGAFEALAAELRANLRAAALARAHRAGVLTAAPLGLCFLPSFVCLGVVPVVLGIAGAVLR
jgi:Flp pilus assembly protein TadB